MSVERFGTGLISDTEESVYEVPIDMVAVIKTISFCNVSDSPVEVDLQIGGVQIYQNKEIETNKTFSISAFDQVLTEGDEIILNANSNEDVAYYISGKQTPIEDIGDTTEWMRDRWNEWWNSEDGPKGNGGMEDEFDTWWNSDNGPKGENGMEAEWEEWFNEIEEGTYVIYEDFYKLKTKLRMGAMV